MRESRKRKGEALTSDFAMTLPMPEKKRGGFLVGAEVRKAISFAKTKKQSDGIRG